MLMNVKDESEDREAEKPSTRKMVVDALCAETMAEQSEGRSQNPTIPLVGSLNVPISEEEEKDVE